MKLYCLLITVAFMTYGDLAFCQNIDVLAAPIAQLSDSSWETRYTALQDIKSLCNGAYPQQAKDAIINLLNKETTVTINGKTNIKNDLTFPDEGYFNYVNDLYLAVASFKDVQTVPILVHFMGNEWRMSNAMAECGEIAVPAIIDVLRNGNINDKISAVKVLGMMIETNDRDFSNNWMSKILIKRLMKYQKVYVAQNETRETIKRALLETYVKANNTGDTINEWNELLDEYRDYDGENTYVLNKENATGWYQNRLIAKAGLRTDIIYALSLVPDTDVIELLKRASKGDTFYTIKGEQTLYPVRDAANKMLINLQKY